MINSSGEKCKKFSKIAASGPNITTVTVETDKKISGEHLKTFQNIESLQECINICHMTRNISSIDFSLWLNLFLYFY